MSDTASIDSDSDRSDISRFDEPTSMEASTPSLIEASELSEPVGPAEPVGRAPPLVSVAVSVGETGGYVHCDVAHGDYAYGDVHGDGDYASRYTAEHVASDAFVASVLEEIENNEHSGLEASDYSIIDETPHSLDPSESESEPGHGEREELLATGVTSLNIESERNSPASIGATLCESGYMVARATSVDEQEDEADDEGQSDLERTPRPVGQPDVTTFGQSCVVSGQQAVPRHMYVSALFELTDKWANIVKMLRDQGIVSQFGVYQGQEGLDEGAFVSNTLSRYFAPPVWHMITGSLGSERSVKVIDLEIAANALRRHCLLDCARQALWGNDEALSRLSLVQHRNFSRLERHPDARAVNSKLFLYFQSNLELFALKFDAAPEEFDRYLRDFDLSQDESSRDLWVKPKFKWAFSTPKHVGLPAEAIAYVRGAKRRRGHCRRCWGPAHYHKFCQVGQKNTPDDKLWAYRMGNYKLYDSDN